MATATPESTDLKTDLQNGSPMTIDEFLALPREIRDRAELRRGVLRLFSDEELNEMTIRNPDHTFCEARVSYHLISWADAHDGQFAVHAGEVGVQLPGADGALGIDVAVFAEGEAERSPDDARLLVGRPRLAVEIASRSDRLEDLNDKVHTYMAGGVLLVWVLDPLDQVVAVYRDGRRLLTASGDDVLEGYDAVPGLAVTTSTLFPST